MTKGIENYNSDIQLTGAPVVIYRDICKRVATCRLCPDPISRGTSRVVISYRVPTRPVRTPRGTIFERRFFFHTHCWAAYAVKGEGAEQESYVRCVSCGNPVTVTSFRVYQGKFHFYRNLCTDCADSERWRECDQCHCWWPRYETSRLIEKGFVVDYYACDHCTDEYDLLTEKVRKRLAREAKKK